MLRPSSSCSGEIAERGKADFCGVERESKWIWQFDSDSGVRRIVLSKDILNEALLCYLARLKTGTVKKASDAG